MIRKDGTREAVLLRRLGPEDRDAILAIINGAAEAYRGVIPADCWHVPYMPAAELASEIAAGVEFSGAARGDRLVGVMGLQHRFGVALIRHAYVMPNFQGRGIGAMLLGHLRPDAGVPTLVGTWRAARWAIGFYERHGFVRVPEAAMAPLLRRYWTVSDRQVTTSAVLASPPLAEDAAHRLVVGAQRSGA